MKKVFREPVLDCDCRFTARGSLSRRDRWPSHTSENGAAVMIDEHGVF
jgi:hypothetical protein